ncbi:MAG: AbrB/MazE/SpoVT family DNA-binding domain-containing protein [Sandaracinaceae bacterium]|nr:AbrB/MazE/SpoVT family DNA-binding domain-containing protein [Sandaracinaceae bacterium]
MGRIDSAGRLVLPARFRKKLGLNAGDEVTVVLEESSLRVMTPAEAIRRSQELVRRYVPAGRRLSQELGAERRREASRE